MAMLSSPQRVLCDSIQPIEVVCVDPDAIGYATFQSHNQKVIVNDQGILMTHLRRRNDAYTAQTWRLSRSTDGGRTFRTIREQTDPTNPPVLETDPTGNVYLGRVDFQTGDGFVDRLTSIGRLTPGMTQRLPRAAAGKYAMMLDPRRNQLYFFSHNNSFHTVDLDEHTSRRTEVIQPGPHAILQYPHLALDDQGALHAAWTTQKHGEYLYWDIHHMVSRDGGQTWHDLQGKQLTLPVIADDQGPALRVSLEDEFDCHTWLSSCFANSGKLHFVYLAQRKPARQHYVRYDLASGIEDRRIQPRFHGTDIELRGLDAVFVGHPMDNDKLYCVGHDQGRLACLLSDDRGETWQDFARTEQTFQLYSINAFRWVTQDRGIVGSFTDQSGSNLSTDHDSRVFFFRIQTGQSDASPTE